MMVRKSPVRDLAGHKFGRLFVSELAGGTERGHVRWRAACECGREIVVTGDSLTGGRTRSCGCLASEERAARNRIENTTHGKSRSPEYAAWQEMKYACLSPNYSRYPTYGGRGITIAQRWADSFQSFFEDVGPRPSPEHRLRRHDKNGNFEPGNVDWKLAKTRR
jgi:hypothetical protein